MFMDMRLLLAMNPVPKVWLPSSSWLSSLEGLGTYFALALRAWTAEASACARCFKEMDTGSKSIQKPRFSSLLVALSCLKQPVAHLDLLLEDRALRREVAP